jgi:hypothetical protein
VYLCECCNTKVIQYCRHWCCLGESAILKVGDTLEGIETSNTSSASGRRANCLKAVASLEGIETCSSKAMAIPTCLKAVLSLEGIKTYLCLTMREVYLRYTQGVHAQVAQSSTEHDSKRAHCTVALHSAHAQHDHSAQGVQRDGSARSRLYERCEQSKMRICVVYTFGAITSYSPSFLIRLLIAAFCAVPK